MHYIVSDFYISFKTWFYPLVDTEIFDFPFVKLTFELLIVSRQQ